MIKDCPVVQDDVVLAEKIFGEDVAIIKGKTTRAKPKPGIHDITAVPKALKMAQKSVILCIDTFFVNTMSFLHTISDTSQWILDWEAETFKTYLKEVFKVYMKAGFEIKYVCANQKFELVLRSMAHQYKFQPNIATAQEHVLVVERSIRVVKERCRATFHSNPFKSLQGILIKSVVQECTRKLTFSSKRRMFERLLTEDHSP
jgi:hypothetical protein